VRSIIAASMRRLARYRSGPCRNKGVMNRIDRQPLSADEAELEYLDGEYRIRKPGAYVRCAVTGDPIPLEDLRYWNVDLQEPYAGPHAKMLKLGLRKPD
jgi:hypothetical protein